MKIAIISTLSNPQNENLLEEAKKENIFIQRIPLGPINITDLANDKTFKNLKEFDLVFFRNGADRVTKKAIGDQLIKHGVKFINSGYYINPLLNSKIFQIHTVSSLKINCPKTITIKKHSGIKKEQLKQQFEEILERCSLPFIMKPEEGSLGKGVELVRTEDDFKKNYKESSSTNIMIQEFIPNDGDYRVIVVKSKAIASFKRIPKEGDFRANISIGGHGEIIKNKDLEKELHQMAIKIAKGLNLEVCGIDLIQSKIDGKIYFIESNSSPQWKGLQATTGINVARHIIKYFEQICL